MRQGTELEFASLRQERVVIGSFARDHQPECSRRPGTLKPVRRFEGDVNALDLGEARHHPEDERIRAEVVRDPEPRPRRRIFRRGLVNPREICTR